MEIVSCGEHSFEIKWQIQNFFCWMREIHSPVISTNSLRIGNLIFDLSLFPMGFSGEEENLVLKVNNESASHGKVHFISWDESVTYSVLTVNPVRGDLILRSDIRFKDFQLCFTSDHEHKDVFTLLFRGKCRGTFIPFQSVYLKSKINAFDSYYTILCEKLLKNISSKEPCIADISSLQGREMRCFKLSVTGEKGAGDSIICKVELRPEQNVEGTLVHIYTYLVKIDESWNSKLSSDTIIFANNQRYHVINFKLESKYLEDTSLKIRLKMVSDNRVYTEGTIRY